MKDLIYKILNFFTGKWYVVVDQPYIGHTIVELEDPTYSEELGAYISGEELFYKQDMVPTLFLASVLKKKKIKAARKELLRGCKWYNVWKANRAFKSGKVLGYSDYLIVAKTGIIPERTEMEIL